MIRRWKMLNQIKMFMLDDSGLETVEWAIVGGLIVAVTAAIFTSIGTEAGSKLTDLLVDGLGGTAPAAG
jgi:pilus assembly protein Flp/PilA